MEDAKADVALLAPVPEVHLLSGLDRCRETGFVAFGSNAGMVLSELKGLVDPAHQADILFYASISKHAGRPAARFRGRFVDFDGAVGGQAKKSWLEYRPISTANDDGWMGFYLVSDLRELELPVSLASLTKRGNHGKFSSMFVPFGPIIIDTPF